jgi:hypothetical protein
MMRNNTIRPLLYYSVIFILGILVGAVIQKTLGVGNLLRSAGIPYPTSVPPPAPTVLPTEQVPAAYRGRLSLFILAGQSNMVGWAPLPEEKETDPRIYVLGNDYHWHLASEPVDSAVNQVDTVSLDRIALFGPSMAFALASLDRDPKIAIGLIPCAKNSSSIGQWQKDLSDHTLYGSCLKRAHAASTMGRISGILFFQGETDALNPILYPEPEPNPHNWSALFTSFVTDFRKDLNEPDLPVIFAQIGSNTSTEAFSNWEVVRNQQASIQLPMTAMITTDDLPQMDGLHFTADSYWIIGSRFAEAYWDLVELDPVN